MQLKKYESQAVSPWENRGLLCFSRKVQIFIEQWEGEKGMEEEKWGEIEKRINFQQQIMAEGRFQKYQIWLQTKDIE